MPFSFWRKGAWQRMVRASDQSLRVETLEGRDTPTGIFAVGSAAGSAPLVTVFDAATRQQKFTITPFDTSFTGGVNVAIGDVTGDGTPDVIVGEGAGGNSTVNVYDGTTGTFLKDFTLGDDTTTTGATVAAADYDGDGRAEIVIGTIRSGQPLVRVVRYADGTVLRGYTPLEGAASVSVATGDVNGDGVPDTVVAAGAGGGPRVVVFSGADDSQLSSFYAFEDTFTGGVTVATGDLNLDGKADIIASAGFLGGPRVQAFDGATGDVLVNFFAYDSTLRAGVTASAFDANGDDSLDIVTVDGPGESPDIKAFDGRTVAQLTTPTFTTLPVGAAWDTTAPSVTVTTTAANPTKTAPFGYTATFGEAVNGFTLGGLTVTNGSVSNFAPVNAKTYTFDVTPTGEGDVIVGVLSGQATDAAGNVNPASATVTTTYDTTAPTVTANSRTTNGLRPALTGTVDDAAATVTVTVGGQTVTATVSGNTWTATVPTALAEGAYTIAVSATDAAGNTGTASLANGLVIDATAPTATVTSTALDPTATNPIPFAVTFDEDVTGFTPAGVTVTNGSVLAVTAVDARTYTVTVVPAGSGTVSVAVAAGSTTDAAGNGSAVSDPFAIAFDGTVTAAAITSTATGPTNAATIPVTIAFTDDVTGFDQTDLVVRNGTVSNFTAVDGRTFTLDLAPTADGAVTVRVAAGAATDAAGNPTAAAAFGIISDRTAPTVTVNATSTGQVTGTAADTGGAGVSGVAVSIRDGNGTNLYWDGTAFTSATEVFRPATDGGAGDFSTWSYALPTVTGEFLVNARATDAAGNQALGSQTVVVS